MTLLGVLLGCSLVANLYFVVTSLKGELMSGGQFGAERAFAPASWPATSTHGASNSPALQEGRENFSAEDLHFLFEAEDFRDALLGYQLLSRQNQQLGQSLKQAWLKTVRGWLTEPGTSYRVESFINAALDVQANDFDFRRLQAEHYRATGASGKILQAIDIYYELLNESPQELQGVLVSEIQNMVKQQVTRLSDQQAWQPLIRFAERLLWHEPMHPPYVFIYARALVAVERYNSAKNSLLSVIYDEYYGAKAKQMIDEIALLDLSDQGIHLLDSQARAADSFDKLCRRYPTMSRERKSRQLLRVLSRLRHQEERFEDFQKDILRTVSDQVRRGIVSPPVPGRSYRAVFSVLDHELPEPLWPAMEEVLANGVTLRMQDVDGHWHPVPLRFAGGAKAVFNRKHLERAVSLQIIIKHGSPDREMFEYAVQHELPVKPMWSMKQRFLRWIASRSPGSMMSPMGGDCSISKGKSQSKA